MPAFFYADPIWVGFFFTLKASSVDQDNRGGMTSFWKVQSVREIINRTFLKFRSERCITDKNIVIDEYFILDFTDWVHVVAFDQLGKLILIRQYRHGLRDWFLELPGGAVEACESDTCILTAQRELREETGFTSDCWHFLGKASPNPALQTNWVHTYVAFDCMRTDRQMLEDSEEIEVLVVDQIKLIEMVDSGDIKHSLMFSSLMLACRFFGALPGQWDIEQTKRFYFGN